jgi:diguanylate cyclase (GGDEF)-like protein/PAS domain S-box-containing protein
MINPLLNADPGRCTAEAATQQLASLPVVYDAVPVGLCVLGRDLRFASINRRMAEMSGRPAEADIGRGLAEVMPGVATQLEPEMRRALQGERVADFELRSIQMGATGEDRVFLVSLNPLCSEDGEVTGVLCSALDITERKRAEAQLRESEGHYRHAVELSPHVPWTAATDGVTVQASSRWAELTGSTEAGGEGWAKTVHQDDLPTALERWSHSLETAAPYDCEYRLRLADGDYRWVRSRAAPRLDAGGRIICWYGTVEDVHDRKLADAALRESERRAREQAALIEAVYAAAPVGLAFHDCELRYLAINDRLAAINGHPAEAMIGRTAGELFDPAFAHVVEAPQRKVIETGKPMEGVELSAAPPSMPGVDRDFLVSYHPVRGSDGDLLGISVAVLEITERKRAEVALRESESRFARAIAAAEMAAWEWDLASDTLQVSAGFDTLFGQPMGTLQTMTAVLGTVHVEDRGQVEAAIAQALRNENAADHGVEFRIPLEDGSERWLRARGRVECNIDGGSPRLIGVTHDITERRKAEQQIVHLAYHDHLTGLANRRLFRQQLEGGLAFAGHGGLLALHYLDLDRFKGINDTLGHPAGDELLRQVADRLRGCLRAGEMVARLGGDEFAIIQPGLSRPEDAAILVQRVIETLAEPYEISGQRVVAGASIGVTLAPNDGITPDELVRNADIALYRTKADGRGTFRFFEPAMDEGIRLAEELKAGLRSALERDELELHFQPLVQPCSGQVTCLEALLRWRHPTRGLMPPTEFIATAEETGLIAPIGEWALRTACCEAVRWPRHVRVAVNLSPVQFRSPGLLQAVKDALTDSGLAAERLELEITESVLLQYDDANLAILRQLRGLGVRIALDDFGTGFSSLGYLLRFAFDKIKIDRSFIVGLPDREESKVIVHAIIGLGRSLGIAVAAEGVETAGQLSALSTQGCSEVQGYLFSRPVSAAEVTPLIDRLRQSQDRIG